jgi:hypothetical protein
MKELELGEGSSPGVTKQLEYTPRPTLVILTMMNKVFNQTPTFGDTEECTGSKAALPH